jgi:phage gp16-like protein
MPNKDTLRVRAQMIQLIQIAKRDLDMADDTYRSLLREIGGVESSTDLDARGRARMLDHFAKLGFVSTKRKQLGNKTKATPATDREGLLGKIDALLLALGLDRHYVEASMVKRICKVDSLVFCTPEHLSKLIAALEYHKRRQGV